METKLCIDNREKTLFLSGKARFLHSSNVELKLKHIIDTKSANVKVFGSLEKHLNFGDLPSRASVDERLRLSAGVKANSYSTDTLLFLKGKKQFRLAEKIRVIRGKDIQDNSTDLKMKALYSLNLKTEEWGGEIFCGLSRTMFRVHDTMDIRVSLGVHTTINKNKIQPIQPVIKLEENCWTLTTSGQTWNLSYML